VAGDVLDHDDGVVHDEPGRDRQRHQREVVEAVAQHQHHAERRDQRQRHRDAGDDRRPQRAQEQVDDRHHQAHRQEQGELDVAHRRAHSLRAVRQDRHLDPLGQRSLQAGQQVFDPLGDLDQVRPRLALHVQDDRRVLVGPARQLGVFNPVQHLGDVGEPHRGAVLVGDDQRRVIAGRRQLVVGRDQVVLAGPVQVPLGLVDVGQRQHRPHVFQPESAAGQRHGIDLHADGGALSAVQGDEADARHLRQLLGQDRVGVVVDDAQR
jgi:hypothetical protein